MDRRTFIGGATGLVASGTLNALPATKEERYQNGRSPWPICLDTFTIRPASVIDKINIAAEAGYDAIEFWDSELIEFEEQGGSLTEIRNRIEDAGLFTPSMIGLWGCLPENEERFQTSLEATRNRMRIASTIGCEFVQAIPNEVGEEYDPLFVSACYKQLLEIGISEYNVKPALVFVKMFPIKTMGQAAAIALDTDHPEARIIPDVFHMYISKGGFNGINQLNGDLFAIFQYNDAPKNMGIDEMQDRDRVYPGDGILPLPEILKSLKASGFRRCVSLELYNPEYHKQNLLEVAKTGLEKTLRTIGSAGV